MEEEEEEAEPEAKPGKKKSKACAADLASCPTNGCAKPGSAHALFNQKKRGEGVDLASAVASKAKTITFEQLRRLEERAEQLLPKHKDLDDRKPLESVFGGFGEGTVVRLVGYVAPDHGKKYGGAHAGGIESVNCRLEREEQRDVHVPLLPRADAEECEGVVVEPIPQSLAQHPSWTSAGFRKLAKAGKLVMIVGPLFWDNEHLVNEDCKHLKSGQPKRMSLWEIHPVTEVWVCDDDACSPSKKTGWTRVD